jgi:hypothetical protein
MNCKFRYKINHVSDEAQTTWWMIPSDTNSHISFSSFCVEILLDL